MDPNPANTLPSPSPSIKDFQQSCTAPSSPEVSELAGLVIAYKLSPNNELQFSCSAAVMNPASGAAQGNRQFPASIGSVQAHGDNSQRCLISSESHDDSAWTSMQTQPGGDDLEHYTFHSSPINNGYSHRTMSGQSSPRSGNSPSYYPITEGGLSTANFPSREYVPAPKGPINYGYSSAPFPAINSHFSSQGFDGSETNLSMRSVPDPYRNHYNSPPSESVASMAENGQSASPGSSSMMFQTDEDMLSPGPASEPGDDFSGSQFIAHDMSSRIKSEGDSPGCSPNSHKRSGSPITLSVSNVKSQNGSATAEEPYAQLIYRALMSTKPRYAMTLQDIYQWFRENTDKGKSGSKGWQNSIRHNLSMNQAFTKIERRSSTGNAAEEAKNKPAQICLSSDSQNDSKKSTKWYLEPWAVSGGVQSTTRYRKGNASRRGGVNSRVLSSTAAADVARQTLTYVRAASGRKGGIRRFRPSQDSTGMRLRTMASGTNGLQMQHQYHHGLPTHSFQSLHQQQQQQQRQQNLMREMVLNGQYTTNTGYHLPSMTLPPGMDYDFGSSSTSATDPQLTGYPPQQHSHSQYSRATSEPTIDEPVTPEPAAFHTLKGGEAPSHLLPLHRATLSTSSNTSNASNNCSGGSGATNTAAFHHPYGLHHGGNVVGVYDEVAERYGAAAAASWGNGSSAAGGGGGGGGGASTGLPLDGLPYGSY
ncbi:hypothetical protein V8F06_013095 [Rhypophila decipiens]